jgi:ABC-type transporter Mla MlaB component
VDGDVMVDVSRLGFVDHQSLHVLGRCAEAHGKQVVLRHAPATVRRLIDVAGVRHVTATAT